MYKTLKCGLGVALLAACRLASADSAEVKISNVSMSAANGQWFYWHPGGNFDAGVEVALGPDPLNPSFHDAASGALGSAADVSVTDGAAVALAQLTARTPGQWDVQGVTASVSVDASGGQGGWSFAKVVDRSIWLGGLGTTLTVSANLDSLMASGPMSQGMVSIQICPNDVCDMNSIYTEAFVDGTGAYSGPSVLSASWSTPVNSGGANVTVRFGLSASVYSDSVTAVPEPSTYALWLAGICGVGVIARRRSH
jgi:hypothetical protein